jgi:membrane associated rhomboid family serine protease
MIHTRCACGWDWSVPEEGATGTAILCPECGRSLSVISAQKLPPGTGAGDFDAFLQILDGPSRVGERIFLGGHADIPIGRQEGQPIRLKEGSVSRAHCRLVRDDPGNRPSRWRIIDNDSTKGLFIADRQIAERALRDGDIIRIGDYALRYGHIEGPTPRRTPPAKQKTPPRDSDERSRVAASDPSQASHASPVPVLPITIQCPSCCQQLPADAMLCVDCGINPVTGKPVLISHGRDEFALHDVADKWIRAVSWIVWLPPLPIPLASNAYGRARPWATWLIVLVTVIASIAFYVAARTRKGWEHPGYELMLWPQNGKATAAPELRWHEVEEIMRELDRDDRKDFEKHKEALKGKVPDRQLDRRALQALIAERALPEMGRPGEFKPYQLLTHAFLHDTSSLLGLVLHLGGNMAFLLVFGSRVNAVLGNLAMLVLYPALAAAAGLAHLYIGDPTGPMLGASGAVMGLGGMYVLLFPVHEVYCAWWLRFFGTLDYTIFTLRGFWLLLIYVAFDALMITLRLGGTTAHWAHLGGFTAGLGLALLLLLSRIFNCGGADLLSVTMGRHAWWLIGKPSRWIKRNRRLAQ